MVSGHKRMLEILAMVVAPMAATFAVPAQSQTWPGRPIRLIIPYPPGGQTDTVARYVTDKLRPVLGQPTVIENKPGAGGIIGVEAAKRAVPDGYTFLYVITPQVAINPHIYDKLPYDALRDFAAVTQLGSTPLAMVLSATLGIKTVPGLIAYAKANPGKLSFASFGTGSGSHILGELLNKLAGIDMVHVPYKGAVAAVADILTGQATMGLHDFQITGPHLRSGRLVAVAVTGTERWPFYPDLPTFSELGYPLDMVGWHGIIAPAGTPPAIVERMGREIGNIIRPPGGRDRMLEFGLQVSGTTPEEFTAIIRRDYARWGEVIRRMGIKAEL